MKMVNLVYCKHKPWQARSYLYELPLTEEVRKGDKLLVEDRHGEHEVEAYFDHFYCSPKLAETICLANGGYYPPAKAIAFVDKLRYMVEEDIPIYYEELR